MPEIAFTNGICCRTCPKAHYLPTVRDSAVARALVAPGGRVTEAIRQDLPTATQQLSRRYPYDWRHERVAMSSATSKWLVDIYPVGEALFTRSGLC
jgi:isoleucyl-tRNA synthetase